MFNILFLARWIPTFVGMTVFLFLSIPAQAEDAVDRIVFGIARYNAFDTDHADYRESVRLEARLASVQVWKLHPWVGLEKSERGGAFIGGGLETDIELSDRVFLTLQTGAGYLDDGGEFWAENQYPTTGLEFRSQIEIGYAFYDDYRLAFAFSHTSNGGIIDPNPGANQISINVHVPIILEMPDY